MQGSMRRKAFPAFQGFIKRAAFTPPLPGNREQDADLDGCVGKHHQEIRETYRALAFRKTENKKSPKPVMSSRYDSKGKRRLSVGKEGSQVLPGELGGCLGIKPVVLY